MKNQKIIVKSYVKLLNSLDWKDEILIAGLKEGLRKFLSNAQIASEKGRKHNLGDYYSKKAITKIKKGDLTNLVFDHMIPKGKYIHQPCLEKAKDRQLTVAYVNSLLDKYWKIAVITKDEDRKMSIRSMPPDWDGIDIFARYRNAGIELTKG